MDELLKVVVMGRAARNTANIKNRQPIGKMYVKAPYALNEFFKAIIEDELNIKDVVFTDDVENFVTYSFKPQLKTVGPKFGKLLGKIRPALAGLDGHKAMAEIKENGKLELDLGDEKIELLEEDLLIDMAQMEGYVSEGDNTVTVVLDTNLTPELLEEGFVREIISKIQTMRKEAGFEVMDRIAVSYQGNEKIAGIFKKNEAIIKAEVLADELLEEQTVGYVKEWSINGEQVTLGVEKR